jgi:small subunit ribosomal protein S8
MSQDIVADGLNRIMNALRARKGSVTLKAHSKLLLSVLALAKLKGYIKSYEAQGRNLAIIFDKLNECKAIKPRYAVSVEDLDKYAKRYLPAKDIGMLIVSTNQGLMAHQTAQDKNIGGCLIAYFY